LLGTKPTLNAGMSGPTHHFRFCALAHRCTVLDDDDRSHPKVEVDRPEAVFA